MSASMASFNQRNAETHPEKKRIKEAINLLKKLAM
jgi:hypothetical protein